MAFARDVYTATGGQTDFTITFPYLAQADVKVFQNGTLKTITTDYTFPNDSTIRLVVGATASDKMVLQRKTNNQTARLVDWQETAVVPEDDLDNDSLQAFYMAQEAIDIADTALGLDTDDLWTAESKRLKNVADPTAAQDAATKNYVDTVALGSFPSPLAVASGGTGAITAAAARTSLGLVIGTDVQADLDVPSQAEAEAGTATTERVWTAARVSDAIAQLAMPRSYLAGLGMSNDTDTDHDIAIAAGECRDDTNAAAMYLSATLTKQIDAVWALGDDAGGLDTGAVANDTWYHVFLIRRSDTGVVDALFSTSVSSPTMPTNYDQKRRIGSVLTNGSANIIQFVQDGDHFQWTTVQDDVSTNNPGASAILNTLSVPSGLKVLADFILHIHNADVSLRTHVWASDPDQTDETPTEARRFNSQTGTFAGGVNRWASQLQIRTNTSSQVRTHYDSSTDTDLTVNIYTRGWYDTRGRDA